MELAYSFEKSESEIVGIVMRLWRPYLRMMSLMLVVAGVMLLLVSAAKVMDEGVCDDYVDSSFCQGAVFFLATVVFVCHLRRKLRRSVTYMFRLGNSNLWRVRLTEECFDVECGDYKFSSSIRRFASRFLICDDVLYLYGDLGQIACFPDWIGHGVERAELAAALEKAGLKDGSRSHARKIVRWLICLAFCAVLLWSCVGTLCHAHANFRKQAVQVELKRQLLEIVRTEVKPIDNPYRDHWTRNGNILQRMVARTFSYQFERYYYIFDKKSKMDKVGLAAREGGIVWLVFLPCGCVEVEWTSDWDERKWRKGVLYQESEKDGWLEKVRELDVSALRE